jgi:hypothetical protein
VGGKWISIPTSHLYMKQEQLYRLKCQGISQITEKDMYNVSNKSEHFHFFKTSNVLII